MKTAKEIASTFFPVGGATTFSLEMAILQHLEEHLIIAHAAWLNSTKKEREACAMIADAIELDSDDSPELVSGRIAAAIRARP